MPTPSPAPLNPGLSSHRPNVDPNRHTDLADLLTRLAMGQVSVAEVLVAISNLPETQHSNSQAPIDGATVDTGRQQRCGFGEVIYGEGKSSDLIQRIAKVQIDAGQSVLITRIDTPTAQEISTKFDHWQHNPVARTLRISAQAIAKSAPIDSVSPSSHHVAVVTAGSTDAPVAEEAIETLTWMGIPYVKFDDIGVAGPQRLLSAVPRLRNASAVIVVAGMEGALPSVVSGHLSVPIFAVPTSVGYGATLGGLTPLLGMLSSCAAGVAVVNIDAGFKAGYMAGLIINQLQKTDRPG
ncbi:MAG: nickel pincer cofactor biosynthesis protein LarB [Pirellulaceae bacterium]